MYKIKHALQKSKKVFIMVLILWIVLSIVLIAPITVTSVESKQNEQIDSNVFFDNLIPNFGKIGENISKVFKKDYIKSYGKGELYLTIGLLICASVGIIKSFPKNEYTDIEHGSSDWASGEQYSVLNKKKGILLAENHYLPVDKRGNTNVLVVGRIWIW